MPRKTWPFISTLACFACLIAFIALNDINYRGESEYRDIQIKTFAAYSGWNVYIGTLRGALLSTNGLGGILDDAVAQKGKVAVLLADLRTSSAGTEPRTRQALEAFVGSIEAGLAAGQDIIDQGRVLLQQPDLPLAYREGRLGLSSLSGKDASSVLGSAAAYQYFQLVGSLEGMDVLFDQLFSDRLESIMSSVGDAAKSAQSAFFVLRLVFLAVLATVFTLTVIGLFGVNRSLRGLADRTSRELDTARDHLSEVQGFLHSAQYRQSLFEMVAGISHETEHALGELRGALEPSRGPDSLIEGRGARGLAIEGEPGRLVPRGTGRPGGDAGQPGPDAPPDRDLQAALDRLARGLFGLGGRARRLPRPRAAPARR